MGRDDTIAAMPDEILTSVADGIATVTMNRPPQRNAMNVYQAVTVASSSSRRSATKGAA